MRVFVLRRTSDISGVSGTGIVAEGVEFHTGQCVLSWFGRFRSIEVCNDIQEVIDIHGHHGTTTVEWGVSVSLGSDNRPTCTYEG